MKDHNTFEHRVNSARVILSGDNIGMTDAIIDKLLRDYPLVLIERHIESLPYREGFKPGARNAGILRKSIETEQPVPDDYIKFKIKQEQERRRGEAIELYNTGKERDTPGFRKLIEGIRHRNRALDRLHHGGEVRERLEKALAVEEILSRLAVSDMVKMKIQYEEDLK